MDTSFHYLVMIIQAMIQKNVIAHLSGTGLTPGQPKVLEFLGRHDGSRQREIAYGCQMDPATLTGILGRMEEHGLVARRSRPEDRRSSYVYLTPLGRERLRQSEAAFDAVEGRMFAGVAPEDRERLTQILVRICGNLTDLEGLQ